MAEIDVVTYRKHKCNFSLDCDEGVRVFREFYSENWFGVVTKKSQMVLFVPALSSDEFKSANDVADRFIEHMKKTTGNTLNKIDA